MGLCQGTVSPLLSQGCARLAGHRRESLQQPKRPQHPKISLPRWERRGGGRQMAAVLMLRRRLGCPLPPGLCPAQTLASLGQKGRTGQGVMSQGLRSPFLPSSKSPAGDQALAAMAASSPALPGALRCTRGSAGSAPPAQTPSSDLAPSSMLPVRGLQLDASSPGELRP